MRDRTDRRWALLLALGLCLGCAERLWLCAEAPARGYTWDHFDVIGMGHNAARLGLFHIYSVDFGDLDPIRGQVLKDGQGRTTLRTPVVLPNYPPLAILLFRIQVAILGRLDSPLEANTFTARLVMGSVPFLFELLTACGLLWIGRRVATERRGICAAVIFWCFPPVAMNSTLWGQVDAFILAPAVLACLFMIDRRWCFAGICFGAAVLLKPQGLVLAPMALYGAVVLDNAGAAPSGRQVAQRLGSMAAGVAAALLCVALPWTVAGGLAWVKRCYVQSFLDAFPDTTLFAFNFWYIDALRHDSEPGFVLDSTVRVFGLSKDAWGRVLLLAAMAGGAIVSWRRYGRKPTGLVLFSALWLWSLFFWPTRVHERFIIYCVPFVIVAATMIRGYWPVLLGLLVLGMAEHSWNQWMRGPCAGTLAPRRSSIAMQYQRMAPAGERGAQLGADGAPARGPSLRELEAYHLRIAAGRQTQYRQARGPVRRLEIVLTVISLLSYVGAYAVPLLGVRTPPAVVPPRRRRDEQA